MKNKTLLFLLFTGAFISSLTAQAKEPEQKRKLIFAVDVIRHGDRTPTSDVLKAYHQWSQGPGQLTPLGMHQEYELGKKFRHRYVEQEKLLPPAYQQGTLYVRSTDIDRTLMSAQSLLIGLYPPGTGSFLHPSFLMNWFALPYGFQPIPIHTVPQDRDTLLLSCHSKEEIEQKIEAIPEYHKKENELKSHFAAWSQATGIPIRNGLDLEELSDALYIARLKHIVLPKGTISPADIDMILQASNDIFKKSFLTDNQSGKNLLKKITQLLEQAAEKKSSLKYVLFSAHDATIMSLLAAMTVPIKETPHYASDMNVALYENENHHFEVEVTLNDKPVPFTKNMGNSCSLQEFLERAKNLSAKSPDAANNSITPDAPSLQAPAPFQVKKV